MTKEEVIAQIRKAFADTKYPGDDIGYSPADCEAQELEQAFKGRAWQNLSRELLIHHRGDSFLFTPKALA